MKFLILTALVASCACWQWNTEQKRADKQFEPSHTRFEGGSTYNYRYESQVLTGLPTFSRQYAGMKVICDVKFSLTSRTDWQLEMQDIKLYSLNNEIHDVYSLPPTKQLPVDLFTALPDEQCELIKKKLSLPLKFTYENGNVKSISVTDGETNWSIDLKRSVLSMLQVKLQPDTKDFKVSPRLQYNQLSKENVTTFHSVESGLEGTCYSTFHTYSSQDNKPNWYKIIKIRDGTNCMKVNVESKVAYQQHQSNCDCRNNMINRNCQCAPVNSGINSTITSSSVVRTEYDITSEDRQSLIIKKVVQTIQQRQERADSPNNFGLITSNQTLTIVDQKRMSQPIKSSLTWRSVEQPWKIRVLPSQDEKLMMTPAQLVDQINKLVDEIILTTSQPERFEDHMTLFYQTIHNLRLCSTSQLTQIFSQYKNNDRKLKLYVDALKSANTTEADSLLLTKIVSGEINTYSAVSILMQFSAEKVPYLTLLDNWESNLLPALKQSKKVLYSHAMLAFGSMVRRYIYNEEILIDQCLYASDKDFHQQNIYKCRKYQKYVEGVLDAARTDSDKITALKTFANMGSINSISSFQKYLVNTESTSVRIEAVNAFINLGSQNKLKVVQYLMPIMLNDAEPTELRVAAFVVLMKCRAHTPLEELQYALNYERDIEFKTFVIKYLKNMIQNSDFQCQKYQMRVRETLKTIRAFRMSSETTDFEVRYGLKNNNHILRYQKVSNSTSQIPRFASLQHRNDYMQRKNDILEFGFRSEGMDKLMRPQHDQPELSLKDRIVRSRSNNGKPSLTFYVKVLGQEVSYAYLDESLLRTVYQRIQSNVMGFEIPVSIYNTMLVRPAQVRKLQSNGVWTIHENSHVVIVDIQGTLRVEMPSLNRMPIFTFTSTKPIRADIKAVNTHRVDMGFATAGLSSSYMIRGYVNAAQTYITYDLQTHRFMANFTNPEQSLFSMQEMKAHTTTFVLPQRLPIIIKSTSQIAKDLKVDETARRVFNDYEIETPKSINLQTKLNGEVNIPELYSIVRDRMHLLPTQFSTYKQNWKFTTRPVSSAVKTVSLHFNGRYFTPTEELVNEHQNLKAKPMQKDDDSIFSFLWNNEEEERQFDVQEMPEKQSFLEMPSLGSLCHRYSFSLGTVTNGRVLNITANLTTNYDNDEPITRALFRLERPPIPQKENERVEFVDEFTSTQNPGSRELVHLHKMYYGSVSNPKQSTMNLSWKFRQSYKDNVCNMYTVYGCKDQYGVFYPIYYNNSIDFDYENTEMPKWVRQTVEPYLLNNADSVFMYRNKNQRSSPQRVHLNYITRLFDNQMDFIVRDDDIMTNISRVYLPLSVKLDQFFIEHWFPINSYTLAASDMSYLPIQQQRTDVFAKKRDLCVYSYPKIFTFDKKEISVPQTDCEIVLTGNCARLNKQMEVTVIPEQDMSTPKELKVLLGNTRIQMEVVRKPRFNNQEIEVRINGQVQPLEQLQRRPIMDKQEKIAIINCEEDKCELLSANHGIYINMNKQRVTVETDTAKSQYLCGVCAARTGLPTKPSVRNSMEIVKENLLSTNQCSVREPVILPGVDNNSCKREHKHRLVRDVDVKKGKLLKCITEDTHQLCSDRCSHKSEHMKMVKARCVTDNEAKHMGLATMMLGNEVVVENRHVIEKMLSKGMKKMVQVQAYKQCS